MKKMILIALSALTFSSASFAATYCGRISCAGALNGCQVNDGNTNPIVFMSGSKVTSMLDRVAEAVEAMAFQCGCVEGRVALGSSQGRTFVSFVTATNAYPVAEARCQREGL